MKSTRRSPTAEDRRIVDWLSQLKPGAWCIEVEGLPADHGLLGSARLKREGMMEMTFDKTIVTIYPKE